MKALGTQRTMLHVCWYTAAIVMALYALQVATGVGGPGLTGVLQDYAYNGLLLTGAAFCIWRGVAIREERLAWLVMGAGIVVWTAADIIWTALWATDPNAPYPSISDALWIAWYPATYVTLVLLARTRIAKVRRSLLLDGVIAAVATAALACALSYGTVVHSSTGELSAAVLTNLAYPTGDLILLGLVVAIIGLCGWRPGRAWMVLALGLVLNAVGDGIYLLQTVNGTYHDGSMVDTFWPASSLIIGLSAWQPAKRSRAVQDGSLRVIAVPFACGLVAVGILAWDHFSELNALTVVLSAVTLVLVLVRTAVVFLENQRMIARSREEARTDALTGLRNRRSLMDDLDEEIRLATAAYPRALILFDLDGFKEYNDTFGHPAGDGLLVRLGRRLSEAVGVRGRAYRLGGDEFCVLVQPGLGGVDTIEAACVEALTERGEGFTVSSSHGTVIAPDETTDPTEALQLADRRMYARKGDGRASAGRQSRDVLMSILSERQPDLHEHLRETAELALAVGRELDMAPEELDEVARAAELHDVGKVAIPEAILDKPGPLDETEWAFMRRHTLIGERILLSAPALRPVAQLVRASHEHWDGSGYPDGLAGERIPLGARVVAVCDAFDAMTTDRPYRARVDEGSAVRELRRCAGSQFDPRVVDAFLRVLDAESATAA
jgi:diguanylate cyclase (GGDEF)-like protein